MLIIKSDFYLSICLASFELRLMLEYLLTFPSFLTEFFRLLVVDELFKFIFLFIDSSYLFYFEYFLELFLLKLGLREIYFLLNYDEQAVLVFLETEFLYFLFFEFKF